MEYIEEVMSKKFFRIFIYVYQSKLCYIFLEKKKKRKRENKNFSYQNEWKFLLICYFQISCDYIIRIDKLFYIQ